jgi:hypothetical protein
MRPELFGARLTTPIALQWDALQRYRSRVEVPTNDARNVHRTVASVADVAPPTFLQYNVGVEADNQQSFQRFRRGLRRAQFYYMHGLNIERPVQQWFEHDVPAPSVSPGLVAEILAAAADARDSYKSAAEGAIA